MPEGMSIWRDRNVSCDVAVESGRLYVGKIFSHKAVKCKMKQVIKCILFLSVGKKGADGWQAKRKCRRRLLFG